MIKSSKSFVKIGSSLQIALFFLFCRNFQAPPPASPAYLILPNVPTHPPPPPDYWDHPPFIRDPRVVISWLTL